MRRVSCLLVACGLGLLVGATPASAQTVRRVLQAPASAASVDEGPMWAALNSGDMRLYEELVLRAQRKHPGWRPSAALERARGEREARSEVREARSSGDDAALEALSASRPALFGCADPDNLWALAEARARAGDEAGAWALFVRAVRTCPADIRLTTLRKAQGRWDAARVRKLLDLPGSRSPAEDELRRELDAVLAGRAYGAGLRRLASLVGKAGPDTATPGWPAGLERQIAGRRDGKAALLAGWWYHKHGQPEEALAWFDRAASWGASKEAEKGLVAAYLAGGEAGKAAEIVRRDPSAAEEPAAVLAAAQASKVFGLLEEGELSACIEAAEAPVVATRADVATARGWCLLGLERPREALTAFEEAERLAGGEVALQQDARKGQIAAIRATGEVGELERLLRMPWLDRAERIEIEAETARRRFLTHADARDWSRANEAATELERRGIPLGSEKDMLWAGWVAMRAGDCPAATRRFDRLKESTDPDTAREAWQGWWAADRAARGDGCS